MGRRHAGHLAAEGRPVETVRDGARHSRRWPKPTQRHSAHYSTRHHAANAMPSSVVDTSMMIRPRPARAWLGRIGVNGDCARPPSFRMALRHRFRFAGDRRMLLVRLERRIQALLRGAAALVRPGVGEALSVARRLQPCFSAQLRSTTPPHCSFLGLNRTCSNPPTPRRCSPSKRYGRSWISPSSASTFPTTQPSTT